jgi:Ca-activated chloride channel homolog
MRLWLRILIAAVVTVALYVAFHLLIVRPGLDSLGTRAWGREVELLAPRWLGLICFVPFLWLVRGTSLVDMSRLQQAISVGVRALILIGIAGALARPSMTSFEQRVCTVFVVDVSDSISDDQIHAARETVDKAWQARGQNEVKLVTFAERPMAVPLAKDATRVPELVRHTGKRAGESSDLQAAVQHAYGLFPPNLLRRIVLVSDGNETSGDVLAESYRAASKGIKLHTARLPERKQKEVLVRSLVPPKEVRMGAPFDLAVEIYSTHKEKVTLTLYKDEFINGLDGRKSVDLEPGRNEVKFKSMVQEAGTVSYRLVMSDVKHDTWKSNNTATATLPVFGRPKVLYVEGEPIYASYLQRALDAEKIDVTVRGPYGVPSSLAELQKFDLLIVSDVPAMYVGLSQMAAIQAYVRDLGGGFIMTGGQNSFGAGGYYGTMIEKILPVRFDTEKKRDQPSLAMALIIDRSGSMTGQKLELAKDAAKATTELLGASDLISVVCFDTTPYVVVRLQRAANRLRILNDISRIQATGGTSIKPALQEGYNQLQGASAKVRHMILLSDGQSPYEGISQLVDEMAQARITVSAVGVGDGADRTLLQMIAERGNGRFYFTEDANNIPKIFTKETTQVARSALVEQPFRVRLAKPSAVVAGIDWGSSPMLRGYVSTKAKPLSETLLVSEHAEPIFAMWRVGLGKTAAFTSDVKNRWATDWLRWSGYSQFWAQAAREIMRHRIQRSFDMRAEVAHGVVKVTVDAIDRADRFINGLDSTLTVLDPRRPGHKVEVGLQQTAAGRYEAAFRLPNYGSFLLRATHRQDGKVVAESVTSLAVPYPKEYVDLVPDQAKMARAARSAGGVVDPTPAVIFDPGKDKVRFYKDLWPWLIYGLLGLFLLDVLLRRVRIFGYGPTPSL